MSIFSVIKKCSASPDPILEVVNYYQHMVKFKKEIKSEQKTEVVVFSKSVDLNWYDLRVDEYGLGHGSN